MRLLFLIRFCLRVLQEKGLIQILPDDIHGRPVLFYDRIRSVKSVYSREEVARIHFYLLHVMSKREGVAQRGYVRVVFLKVGCLLWFRMEIIVSSVQDLNEVFSRCLILLAGFVVD